MLNVFAAADTKLTDCTPGFSFFFDLVRKEWTGNNFAPLHRICTLMRKMGVRSLLREVLVPDVELNAEVVAARTRTGGNVTLTATRFTFFRALPDSIDWHDLNEAEILGYAVILTLGLPTGVAKSYVFESVVRVPAIWDAAGNAVGICNYYIHSSRTFSTTIGTAADHRQFAGIVFLPTKRPYTCLRSLRFAGRI